MSPPPRPAPAAAPWRDVVLVCSKCLRRQDREDFRGELKQALKKAGRRDLRVVLVGCLDLCPKDGITLARGADLGGPDPRLIVVDGRMEAREACSWLLQDQPSGGR